MLRLIFRQLTHGPLRWFFSVDGQGPLIIGLENKSFITLHVTRYR